MVQYLDKQMDTFQVCQFIVSDVHAQREKKSCISPVDNFVCAKLHKKKSRLVWKVKVIEEPSG